VLGEQGGPPLRPMDARLFVLASLGTVVFVFASRLPFASRVLFSWDSANYAMALESYNVAFHQPHPPGNPLYVAAAWLVHLVVADANLSYILLSVTGSAVAAIAVFGLATRLYGALVGILAVLLFITGPMVWSHGVIAYPYVFLAVFSALLAWCVAETRWGGRNLTVLGAVLLALGAGIRPDLVLWLLPAWAYGALHDLRAALFGGALAAAVVAAWAVPMVELSGGWAAYASILQLYEGYWGAPAFWSRAFVEKAWQNLDTTLGFLEYSLGPVALLFLAGLGRLAIARDRGAWQLGLLLVLLVAPALTFFVFIHIGNPGYVLAVVPVLVIVAAAGAARLCGDVLRLAGTRSTSRRSALGAALALLLVGWCATANATRFLNDPGEGSLRHIRANDAMIEGIVGYVRATHGPDSTVVIAGDLARQLQYYLPDFAEHDRLLPLWESADPAILASSRLLKVPDGVAHAIVVDVASGDVKLAPEITPVQVAPGVTVFEVSVGDGKTIRYGAAHLSVVAEVRGTSSEEPRAPR
jgi:hypothetical protein